MQIGKKKHHSNGCITRLEKIEIKGGAPVVHVIAEHDDERVVIPVTFGPADGPPIGATAESIQLHLDQERERAANMVHARLNVHDILRTKII